MFLPAKNLETGKWTEMGEDATSYLNTFIAARLDTGGKKTHHYKKQNFQEKVGQKKRVSAFVSAWLCKSIIFSIEGGHLKPGWPLKMLKAITWTLLRAYRRWFASKCVSEATKWRGVTLTTFLEFLRSCVYNRFNAADLVPLCMIDSLTYAPLQVIQLTRIKLFNFWQLSWQSSEKNW